MENKIVRVGFTSLDDEILTSHLPYLLKNNHVEIVGSCSGCPASSAKASVVIGKVLGKDKEFSLKCFDNVFQMMNEIDALIVSSDLRGSDIIYVEKACEKGFHILSINNFCKGYIDIEILERKFSFADPKTVFVQYYPRRYNSRFMYLKRELNELIHDYGKVRSIKIDCLAPRVIGVRHSLAEYLVHDIDYMNYLFGVKDIDAHKVVDNEDGYNVIGKREDGILFYFSRTCQVGYCQNEILEVSFDNITVHIETIDDNCYIYEHLIGKRGKIDISRPNMPDANKQINDNFIYSIIGITKPMVTREEIFFNTENAIEIENFDALYK